MGIGGGTVMVPFLYLVYSRTVAPLSAQTAIAHATSLGAGFVASALGTWRYARAQAIDWRTGMLYGLPSVLSAFLAARFVATVGEGEWIRGAFGCFLLASAADMARRARAAPEQHAGTDTRRGSGPGLAALGLASGLLAGFLGVGGGILALPAMLYVGRLPVRALAPTSLAAVALATGSGMVGYLTAPPAAAVSRLMVGFVDFRMSIPLALGALATVPLGVWINRQARARTLYWIFAAILGALGARLVRDAIAG